MRSAPLRSRLPLIVLCLFLMTGTALAAPGPGDQAPPVVIEELLQGPDGATFDWDSLRGKVVMLEFWATWCKPCVASFPHLNKMVEELAEEEIVFLSISDESRKKVLPFLADKPLKSWVALDTDRSVFKDYGVQGIPYSVIIDRDGKILAATHPASLTTNVLRDALAGKELSRLPDMSSRSAEGGPMGGMPKSLEEIFGMTDQRSRPGDAHGRLASFAGDWQVEMEMQIAPGSGMEPLKADGKGEGRLVLGGRYLELVSLVGETTPMETRRFIGFDPESDEPTYTLHSFDSGSLAPTMAEGRWDEATGSLVFDWSDTNPMMGEMHFTQTLRSEGEEGFILTMEIDLPGMGKQEVERVRFRRGA
jgi:thiol-disulfide isomerase/thioredoxin